MLLSRRFMIIHLIAGQIKEILYKVSFFPEPYSRNKSNIKFELYLSNYAPESGLNRATDIDISKFPKKANLAS